MLLTFKVKVLTMRWKLKAIIFTFFTRQENTSISRTRASSCSCVYSSTRRGWSREIYANPGHVWMQQWVSDFLGSLCGILIRFSVPSRLLSWISISTLRIEALTSKGSLDRKYRRLIIFSAPTYSSYSGPRNRDYKSHIAPIAVPFHHSRCYTAS